VYIKMQYVEEGKSVNVTLCYIHNEKSSSAFVMEES
jgi:hypothetical protein